MKNKVKIGVVIAGLLLAFLLLQKCFQKDGSKKKLDDQEEKIDTVIPIQKVDVEPQKEEVPPLEIYVLDQKTMPKDRGIKGTTYTAKIYVLDNVKRKLFGPFRGSSYPNSKETPKDSDRPNTINAEVHLFNNLYGHNGSQVKGLNLIDTLGNRITNGFSWSKNPTQLKYVNVHTGVSDNGNYNSRGSLGCITIHPLDLNKFWKHFDFSLPRNRNESPLVYTKGSSSGTVFVSRTDNTFRKELIRKLKKVYE